MHGNNNTLNINQEGTAGNAVIMGFILGIMQQVMAEIYMEVITI